MSNEVYGLEDVLRDLDMTSEEIDEAMDEISKEVATEILDKAIENVDGPKNMAIGKVKKGRKRIKKAKTKTKNKESSSVKAIKLLLRKLKKKNDIPYPVSVNTGNLKRSLKIKRMGKGSHKVFADRNIASYAYWVHEGHTRMKARPFLDDAVQSVMDSNKYLDIATDIIDDALNK